jgi:hypothetical protein
VKRYQVLLPDWLEENIKYYVEKYGLSFSEGLRAEIYYAILTSVPKQFPEYKPGISSDELHGMIQKTSDKELTKEQINRLLSRVYFEARKAVEYRLSKEKEREKKKT